MNNQFEKSYALHEQHFVKYRKGGDRAKIAQSWFAEGTIGYEQAQQRNAISDPLLAAYPAASWLTVGDGRYGGDAHYLASKGADATASDISDALLREGAQMGFISKFSKENAEELSQLFAIPESKKRNDRITEIVESLSSIQQTKVLAALERVDGLATEKAAQLAT